MSRFASEVTFATLEKDVLQSDLPVLVEFTAEWCPPCKALEPILHEIAQKYAGKLKVCTVDCDTETELTGMFSVYGMPTLLLFRNGEVVERLVGFRPRTQIESRLAAYLSEPEKA